MDEEETALSNSVITEQALLGTGEFWGGQNEIMVYMYVLN